MSYFSMDNNHQKYIITFCQSNSIIVVYLSEYDEFRSETFRLFRILFYQYSIILMPNFRIIQPKVSLFKFEFKF